MIKQLGDDFLAAVFWFAQILKASQDNVRRALAFDPGVIVRQLN